MITVTIWMSLAGSMISAAEPPGPLPPIESVTIGAQREIRVNGEPFLPIMSWAQAPSSFREFRAHHFNTFMGMQSGVMPANQADAARDAGGYAVAEFGIGAEEAIDHPYLLAWSQRDEPDMPRRREQTATPDAIESARESDGARFQPKVAPSVTAEIYRNARKTDPSRPVFVTFTGHFSEQIRSHYNATQQAELYTQFAQHADVLGFDIYPIYGHGRPGWLNHPAHAARQLVRLGENRKPVYAWIETSKGSRWMTYENQPDVLPEHTRFQVWGVLIRGATAIGYFTHAWQPTFREFAAEPEMRQELARLNARLTRLAPAILAPPADRDIRMRIGDGLHCHFKTTEHDGHLYIFAQNIDLGPGAADLGQFDPISPRAGAATFHVPGLSAGSTVEVIDEDRTIAAGNGRFEDRFEPLSEHIYRIPIRELSQSLD